MYALLVCSWVSGEVLGKLPLSSPSMFPPREAGEEEGGSEDDSDDEWNAVKGVYALMSASVTTVGGRGNRDDGPNA